MRIIQIRIPYHNSTSNHGTNRKIFSYIQQRELLLVHNDWPFIHIMNHNKQLCFTEEGTVSSQSSTSGKLNLMVWCGLIIQLIQEKNRTRIGMNEEARVIVEGVHHLLS